MSKKKTVKGVTSVVKHLSHIDQEVAKYGASMVQSLAVEAAEEAQNHIMKVGFDQNFTQRYGPEAIAREVGAAKISDTSWGVVAPVNTKTYQMAENMYFAEYGAGIMRDRHIPAPVSKKDWITVTVAGGKRGVKKRSFKVNGNGHGTLWAYKTTPNDMAKDATTQQHITNSDYPVRFLTTSGWLGVTDRSKPLHYMKHARAWLRKNGAEKAKKSLQTVLYRRYKERKSIDNEGEE